MVLLAQSWSLIYQFWIHTERVVRLPRWVEAIFNTPSHHRVHHGSNEQYLDKNYGGILIVWDRLFGTFEPEGERVRYGLTTNIETFNPVRVAFHEYARPPARRAPRARLAPAPVHPAAGTGLGAGAAVVRLKDDELRPLLRGLLHAYAFWVALVAGAVLVALAPDATARVAALVYGVGLCALFAASGLYHRWRWNPRWRPLLRRIDHSTIFVFIAASYVADRAARPVGRPARRRADRRRGRRDRRRRAHRRAGRRRRPGWTPPPTSPSAGSRSSPRPTWSTASRARRSRCSWPAASSTRRARSSTHAATRPVAADLRLPRGLPHARDPRRRGALRRHRGLGHPGRRVAPGSQAGHESPPPPRCG